jgi:hypothetical protein
MKNATDSTPDWNILAKFFPVPIRATQKVKRVRAKKNKCLECESIGQEDFGSEFFNVLVKDCYGEIRQEGRICNDCLDTFRAGDCTITQHTGGSK